MTVVVRPASTVAAALCARTVLYTHSYLRTRSLPCFHPVWVLHPACSVFLGKVMPHRVTFASYLVFSSCMYLVSIQYKLLYQYRIYFINIFANCNQLIVSQYYSYIIYILKIFTSCMQLYTYCCRYIQCSNCANLSFLVSRL